MTITLINLYNTAASQEWAMYDNDATSDSEMETSLVLALNKAILDIYASYEFPFRERTHLILTLPEISEYTLPNGLIRQDKHGNYLVKYNGQLLKFNNNETFLENTLGIPEEFYLKGENIVFNPIPIEKGLVTIEYTTIVIGENAQGEDIYSLKNGTDKLIVPVYLEELLKDAIITRTMLNTIASETDENYSAYKKQADKSLKILIKYANGIKQTKHIQI